jgi:hypothetical protein
MTLAPLLEGPPSLLAWRRICASLDALDGAELIAQIAAVEGACEDWPDEVRRAPGRWLRDLCDGRSQPRLRLVRAVDLTLCGVEVAGDRLAWTDAPELSPATIVRVLDDRLGDDGVQRWLRSPNNSRIHELALASGLTDRAAGLLAADRRIPGLRSLALFRNAIGPAGIAALISAAAPALQQLLLGRNQLGKAGIWALAGPTVSRPSLLDLDCNRLDGGAVQVLATAPLLGGVKILNLSNNAIGVDGCEALAGCSRLESLEVLYLHRCGLDDAAVAALLRAPWLPRLKNLALSDNALSMASVERLAAHGGLGLAELDICHNPGIAGAQAASLLRSAPQLADLSRLCL